MRQKQEVRTLVSTYFRTFGLGYTTKSKCTKFQAVIQRYAQFKKRSWTSFSKKVCEWFFKKNICHVILTDQIPLPDCLYCLRYWEIIVIFISNINFEINLSFLNKQFSCMTKL